MTFASDIKKATERYKEGYREVVSTSLFKLSRGVVFSTPEDTGRAQGNWFASTDTFSASKITDSKTPDFNQIKNITDGIAGSTFYLINNLPYIGKLEYGHSKKAKAGMVRINIENFSGYLQDTINNL